MQPREGILVKVSIIIERDKVNKRYMIVSKKKTKSKSQQDTLKKVNYINLRTIWKLQRISLIHFLLIKMMKFTLNNYHGTRLNLSSLK